MDFMTLGLGVILLDCEILTSMQSWGSLRKGAFSEDNVNTSELDNNGRWDPHSSSD